MRILLFALGLGLSIQASAIPKIAGRYTCTEVGGGDTYQADVKLLRKKLFITGLDVSPLDLGEGLECINSPKQQSVDIDRDKKIALRIETSATCTKNKILLTLDQKGPGDDTDFQTSLTVEKANVLYIGVSARGYVQGEQVDVQKDYLCEMSAKP